MDEGSLLGTYARSVSTILFSLQLRSILGSFRILIHHFF